MVSATSINSIPSPNNIPNSMKPNGAFAKQSISDLTTEIRSTTGDVPPPLIGASTTVIGQFMYVFGGRVASSRQMTNHLYILNLSTLEWMRHIAPPDSAIPPYPRYFHSACSYLDRYIVIFGGMGNMGASKKNAHVEEKVCALEDVCIFDIETMCWIELRIEPSIFTPQPRYAHLATIWDSNKLVIIGGQDLTNQHVNEINIFNLEEKAWIYGGPFQGPHDAYRTIPFCPSVKENFSSYHGKSVTPFWKSKKPNGEEQPDEPQAPLCIYSNYNFSDVNRDLFSFNPMKAVNSVDFNNHAEDMLKSSSILPPGLRFPTGTLMGNHFIISGTCLSATQKSFQIWALNLINLTWSHIDTGNIMVSGSWNRGVLSQQKYFVLGHMKRDLKEDYSYRRTNFEHIAIIDLEAFGVYNPPSITCSMKAQELGLSLLNDSGLGDIVIWTADQQSILANSVILSQRWPGFADLLKEHKPTTGDDMKIQKKHLLFPENYVATLAFLQYIYTDHLLTAQQYQPQILCRLLILADMYQMRRLAELVTYALHQTLTISTASLVYETATLALQGALQVRALKMMINAKRIILSQMQHAPEETQNHHHEEWQHPLPISPSNSYTPHTSYYSSSDGEPLSPTISMHSSSNQSYSNQSYSSLRRLANNTPGMSPSSSEKIQHRYMYATTPPGSIKSPSFPPIKKNGSLTTTR